MNASQHASGGAPSRFRFRRALAGPLVTLCVLGATELLARLGYRLDYPSPLWLVTVSFAAYQGGRLQGLVSAFAFTLYGAYFFRPAAGFAHYIDAKENVESLVTLGVVAPAIALMVGALKRRTVYLARRDAAVQSLQRVGELLHDVEAIVWEADAETWQFSFVSHRAESLLGYPVDEWLSRPDFWASILHADDRQAAQALCRSAVREGRDNDFEYRVITRDGRVVWLRDLVRVVPATAGRRKQLRGVMIDVTAHKREDAVKAARRRVLELIAGGGPLDGLLVELVRLVERHADEGLGSILLADPTGKQLLWRAAPSLPEAFVRAQPMIAIGLGEFCAGAAAARRARVVVTDIATDSLWECGRELPLEHGLRACWSQPIIASDGTLLGVFATFHRQPGPPSLDEVQLVESVAHAVGIAIERQRSEAAVSQTLSLLRATLESTADGILVVDLEGKILSANRKFQEMWRLPVNVIGSHTEGDARRYVLAQLKDPDAFQARVQELYAQPEIESFDVIEFKDGRVFERFSQPQRVEGRSVGRVWSFRDMSSRRRAEEALRERDEQLRQAQKLEAIGLLAGGVAHDFNNLLTGITGYSELALKMLAESDPLHHNLEEIRKGAERAALLTRQLLAFSRKQVMQPKVIDLDAVVTDMSEMLRRTIGEHIELLTLHDARPLTVRADPGQLEQVIMNLAINARDAMAGGGRLTIETSCYEWGDAGSSDDAGLGPGSYAVLRVTDTGTGMDEATSARVFEPFFTTKEMGRGTGLGLATVYGIVRQSGGNISVDSEVGRGTSFRVYLPRVNESVDSVGVTAQSLLDLRGCETVLLVEDEASVRHLVSEVLRTNGYTVLEAADGLNAVQVCESHASAIDLLITDVVMPRMSGQDLARRLVVMRPLMRVLYMSGYAEGAVLKSALRQKGAAFMPKPFTPDALVRKVREALDLRALDEAAADGEVTTPSAPAATPS